jgi:hypothetical protein
MKNDGRRGSRRARRRKMRTRMRTKRKRNMMMETKSIGVAKRATIEG